MSSIENLSRTKKAILLVAVSAVVLVALITALEIAAYFWLQRNMPKHHGQMSMNEFLLSKPLPFEKADDYEEIRRDWAGLTNCPKNRIINDAVTGFPRYEISNVSCDGPVTVRNGLRTTTGAVPNAKNRILFFGGSTMWGTGSADRNTIPSLVQKRLTESSHDYGVVNYGFSTVVIAQQVKYLKSIPVFKGDIVVFYDGGNDIWNGVVYGNPDGNIIGYNDANLARALINRAKFFLSNYSNSYQMLGQIRNSGSPSPCLAINDDVINARAAAGFNVYYRNILEAKRFVEAAGGRFFHFLQPSLISSPPLSLYEDGLIAGMSDEMRCGIDAFAKGYEFYKRKYIVVQKEISGKDITDVLDSSKTEEEYFWDYIHISSTGNKLVAGEIYKTLLQAI